MSLTGTGDFTFLLLVHVQTIPEDDSYKRKAQEVHSGSEQADPRFVSANYVDLCKLYLIDGVCA